MALLLLALFVAPRSLLAQACESQPIVGGTVWDSGANYSGWILSVTAGSETVTWTAYDAPALGGSVVGSGSVAAPTTATMPVGTLSILVTTVSGSPTVQLCPDPPPTPTPTITPTSAPTATPAPCNTVTVNPMPSGLTTYGGGIGSTIYMNSIVGDDDVLVQWITGLSTVVQADTVVAGGSSTVAVSFSRYRIAQVPGGVATSVNYTICPAVAIPTATPIPPTATPVPPTATPTLTLTPSLTPTATEVPSVTPTMFPVTPTLAPGEISSEVSAEFPLHVFVATLLLLLAVEFFAFRR